MMMMRTMRQPLLTRLFVASLLGSCLPAGVAAQDAARDSDSAAQAASPQGPMVVERVHNGFAVAPDFRLSKIDGSTARLAGGYGGWVVDNTLLVGAGGYWLTNNSSARKFGYGGAVVEWLAATDRRFGFGARGLVGVGTATLSDNVSGLLYDWDRDGHLVFREGRIPTGRFGPGDIRSVAPGTIRVSYRRDFFVAEPQASFLVNLSRRLRVNTGVGYRLIGGSDGLDDRLRGVSGSVALELGGSSSTRQ